MVTKEFFRVPRICKRETVAIAVAYIEIQTDEIRDLFSNDSAESSSPLKLRDHGDDGTIVSGLKSVFVSSEDEVRELLLIARSKRATSSTTMNHQSSRTHAMDYY